MLLAGLDIGTGSCKFTVYEDGKIIVQTSSGYDAVHADRHTINANTVWESVENVIFRATESLDKPIAAFAISSFGEAVVVTDANGNVLLDSLLFWDLSGEKEAQDIAQQIGGDKRILEICGITSHRMYSIPKMAWLKNNEKEFKKAKYCMLFEDFIIYRLTGERAISYSLACRTMGFDYVNKEWSSEIFDAVGISKDYMSTPVQSGTIVGKVKKNVAQKLKLSTKTKVVTGGHDQMCVAIGAGCVEEGIGVNGSGTVEAFSAMLGKKFNKSKMAKGGFPISRFFNANALFTYSFSSTGTMLLNWFVEKMLLQNKDALINLESFAPVKPTSLLVTPYFAGTGTPYMDFKAKGMIKGLDLSVDRYSLYRGLLEGITYDLALNVECLKNFGVAINEIRVTGGGALSELWTQIKADVLGHEIKTLCNIQSGTTGCMMLSAVALKEQKNLLEAAKNYVKVDKIFYPDSNNNLYYKDKIDEFKKVFGSIRKIEKS